MTVLLFFPFNPIKLSRHSQQPVYNPASINTDFHYMELRLIKAAVKPLFYTIGEQYVARNIGCIFTHSAEEDCPI